MCVCTGHEIKAWKRKDRYGKLTFSFHLYGDGGEVVISFSLIQLEFTIKCSKESEKEREEVVYECNMYRFSNMKKS